MSRENLPGIRVADSDGVIVGAGVSHAAAADLDGGFNPYRLVHQYLRGRYVLALILGTLLAGVLAYCGWRSTKPLYRSEALIRIAQERVTVMQNSPDYKPMDMFLAFMQSQQALLTSHRVLSSALQDPMWKENGFDVTRTPIDGFASDLKVEYKGGEHLKVLYESDNPRFAATAVQSIVAAYVQLYNATDKKSVSERATALAERQGELVKQVDQLEKELRRKSEESGLGSSNVDRLYEAAVANLTRVEAQLTDVRIALAMTQGRRLSVAPSSPQQIARFDQTMARYVDQRERLEMDLQQLRLRGYGEEHKEIVRTKQALDTIITRIQEYANEFQDVAPAQPQSPTMPIVPGQGGAANLSGRTAEDLRIDEENLVKLVKDVKDQVAQLGARKLSFEALRGEQAKAREELTSVTNTLATMQLESGISGRLSIMSNGEVPTASFRDRRIHLAAAGGLLGLLMPAAGIVAYGMSKRRYRYSGDAADDLSGEVKLLGILPQLPARLTDPESAADAAQCLHQIRVMLQVQHTGHGPVAYLLTSSCPGEGKTSLCAALALSFATSGARTLVVDADLIGQRMTRGYRLDDKPGLREVMQNGAMDVPYYPSGIERLAILPAGVSDGRDACAVSSKSVKKFLAAVREDFDVVLIDSGPILGSLEALVMSQHVDGVILTISREQQKPLVDRAIRQLRSVGAKIAGMVFNKAETADFRRSVGATSLRSIPRNPESSALVKAGVTSTSGFGSLVDSVQTYMPAGQA